MALFSRSVAHCGVAAFVMAVMAAPASAQAPSDEQAALALIGAPYSRTYDPQPGTSPLVLLEGPTDGVAYYRRRAQARTLVAQEKWAEAEPQVEALVRDYPRDPANWMLFADVKQALKKHLESARANARGGMLRGWDLGSGHGLWMASNYLAAGKREEALETLRRLIGERHFFWRGALYDMPEFAGLRDDPRFLALIGWVDTTGWSTARGRAHDLAWLTEEVKRVNPDYRDAPFPAEFLRRHAALKRDLPGLSDAAFFFRLHEMLAVLEQGHLVLFPSEKTANRHLPLRFYAFPEGIFIIDAAPAQRHLIGSRVVRFGTMTAEEALRRIGLSFGMEGEQGRLHVAALLSFTFNLQGMGAITDPASVALTVQPPGGAARTERIATGLAPHGGRPDVLVAPPVAAPPLFLRHLADRNHDVLLPAHDALYLQMNAIRADADETLDQLADRLRATIERVRPANLILDLRHNNGGQTQAYPKLLVALANFGRTPGKTLYVLIGRRTYSAAGNFVTDLERLARPVFVGEPVSECCSLYGDPIRVMLPFSKIQGELTAVKWQLSEPGDRRREIVPDVPVQLTARAFFAGEDPALDAVYRLIAGD